MPIPNPVRLFHITAIANLPAICQAGALLSKNRGAANGVAYQNIAHGGAQGVRAAKPLPNPPGGAVHDYVPFYFAPRSPMLSAIQAGKVAGCTLAQQDIVHLETTVDRVMAQGARFVFYDRNATLAYSKPYTDLARLDAVAWELLIGTFLAWMASASIFRTVIRKNAMWIAWSGAWPSFWCMTACHWPGSFVLGCALQLRPRRCKPFWTRQEYHCRLK
jgi:hypothetical protein